MKNSQGLRVSNFLNNRLIFVGVYHLAIASSLGFANT